QDRQPGRVGGGPAEGAEGVRPQVPDRLLVRVPPAVGVLGRPRRPVELVGDVVVHVVDEQVRVAAVIDARLGAVLGVAFEDGVGGDGGVQQGALAGVGVDDDAGPGRGVAVDDVVRDAVEVAAGAVVLAEVGVQPAVAVEAGDVANDGRGVGRDRGGGDPLVPGVVGGE